MNFKSAGKKLKNGIIGLFGIIFIIGMFVGCVEEAGGNVSQTSAITTVTSAVSHTPTPIDSLWEEETSETTSVAESTTTVHRTTTQATTSIETTQITTTTKVPEIQATTTAQIITKAPETSMVTTTIQTTTKATETTKMVTATQAVTKVVETTVTILTTAPVTEPKSNHITYVLNTNTKKIHYMNCRSVKTIKAKNYSETDDFDWAIANGYVPCKNCNPR